MEIPRIHRLSQQLKQLSGTRCENCGEQLIGPRTNCSACGSNKIKRVEFARTGVLITFTEIFHPPQSHQSNSSYFLGLIQIDGGPRVLTQLTDVSREEVQTGMRLESVFRRLMVDGESGPILYGYKFRPVLCPKAV